MGNTFNPFNYDPSLTKIVDNASYTVPANKHARISIVRSGNGTFSYDLDGASSSIQLYNNAPFNASGTGVTIGVPIFTVPTGFRYYILSMTSGGGITYSWNGLTILTDATNFSKVATKDEEFYIGSGPVLPSGSNAGATYDFRGYLVGENETVSDFWLNTGMQITYPGVILVQEFDNPS